MKSVTIKIGDYDFEVLEKVFENETDFKPTDPRDVLIIKIMKQVIENPRLDLGEDKSE